LGHSGPIWTSKSVQYAHAWIFSNPIRSIWKKAFVSWLFDSCILMFLGYLVDGKYSAWSNYNQCSKECGGGSQKRTRSCTNPAPQYGGEDCVGPVEESRDCNTQKCPGK